MLHINEEDDKLKQEAKDNALKLILASLLPNLNAEKAYVYVLCVLKVKQSKYKETEFFKIKKKI